MRIAYAAFLVAVSASPALAQRGPVIVVPGRPDIPVLMNGVDISWAVVEGDFGLARPGLFTPTVIYRLLPPGPPPFMPGPPPGTRPEPSFFPTTGKQPGYGRLEVVPAPDRPLPPPAESYRRSWSSQSAPGPVTDYPPYAAPPIGYFGGGNYRNDHDHDHDHHHK